MASHPPEIRTVGLTPAAVGGFGPMLQEDEVCKVGIFVFASDHDLGQAYFEYRMLLRRMVGAAMMTGIP